MKGFLLGQTWIVVYSLLKSSKPLVKVYQVRALDIQKALTQARKDLPGDAQIVRIELSSTEGG